MNKFVNILHQQNLQKENSHILKNSFVSWESNLSEKIFLQQRKKS